MDRFEHHLIRTYAARVLAGDGEGVAKRPARAVAAWLYKHAALLGCPEPVVDPAIFDTEVGRIDAESWGKFAPLMESLGQASRTPAASDLERRMRWLCGLLKLSALETDIVRATVRAALNRPFRALVTAFDEGHGGEIAEAGLAILTGHDQRSIDQVLRPNQPLQLLSLVEHDCCGFRAMPTVLKIAGLEGCAPGRLRGALMGKARTPRLEWEDFAHVGETAALAERVLAGALAGRAIGVNILLHGPPGTGKTEFVHTLARRLGADALFVGEADEEGDEPSRRERIAAFAVGRSLAALAGGTLLVVDEADDIFASVDHGPARGRGGSKVFMNRLVERTPAPTLWITNHPDRLGAAVLRRMSLAIRFPEPGRRVRRRVVERIARRRRLHLPPGALDRLAEVRAAPALMDSALRVASLTGGGQADIERAARSVVSAISGPAPPPPLEAPLPFDPALSAADHDLAALADRVVASGERALSFCFHGLPGTGKSAFARHLAERLGLDVIEKRASDLLSMWLGESEKQIALAFQDAADQRAMLVLDEADSLLRDRAGARQAWEVSQVNEMLTWMERHPHPFVCTTNLMDSLDPATSRRFMFKVKFLPMTAAQAREAFARGFGVAPPPALESLGDLTPGDFAVVARKARVLGEQDGAALLEMLGEELAARSGGLKRKIGF